MEEGKTFNSENFSGASFKQGEYEDCRFLSCDFSGTDFSRSKWIDCAFVNCNLSLVKPAGTIFRDVTFTGCKLLGLPFYSCNEFGLSFRFEECILNESSFYGARLRKTVFKNTQLQNVDFTDCDLTASLFDGCDLKNARFENSILEGADFRGSFNYSINPSLNRIKKATFSLNGVAGLLDQYDIQIDPLR